MNIVGNWTYTGQPADSNTDAVRFLMGDTDPSDKLVGDEEIAFALTNEGDIFAAASLVCDHLAARFAREADTSVGGEIQRALSQRSAAFAARAKELRTKLTRRAGFYAGGISIADRDTNEDDTDWARGGIQRGQFTNNESL